MNRKSLGISRTQDLWNGRQQNERYAHPIHVRTYIHYNTLIWFPLYLTTTDYVRKWHISALRLQSNSEPAYIV